MTNLNGILDKVLASGATTGLASGLAGGLAGSFLMSKKGRKIGKSALKVGGVAAVGALAYTAYKKYTNKQAGVTELPISQNNQLLAAPKDSGFLPQSNDTQALQNLELILVKAMIAASRADGQMDVEESQAIFKQIKSFELTEDDEALLMHQMSQKVNMDELVNAATSTELASEIYVVSVIAINDINEAERNYLTMLSARLGLPKELSSSIEYEIEQQGV
jgi:uncharacterized membrane protein YebE (DUF533 family)